MFTKNKTLILILLTVFVDLLGFTIIIPLLTDIIKSPASTLIPVSFTEYDRNIILGWMTAIFAIGTFFASPVLGDLSDRFGRKPMLFVSLLGTFVSRIVFIYSVMTGNLILAFVSRLLDGITGGNISIANAALTDISTPETRAKLFGYFGMTFGFGFIIGPALGAVLSGITINQFIDPKLTPMVVATILSLTTLVLNQTIFPETLKNKIKDKKVDLAKSLTHIKDAMSNIDLKFVLLGIFLFNFGFNAFTTFIGNYWNIVFGWQDKDIAMRFAYIGIILFVTQGIASAKNFYSFKKPIDWLILILPWTAFAIVLNIAPSIISNNLIVNILMGLSLTLVPLFNAFIMPNLNVVLSRKISNDRQGEAMGLSSSVTALAQAVPPIIAGYFANLNPILPLVLAGCFVLASFFVFKKEVKLN